uniref:Uncharacterized protein n=1 Tax=Cyprinus carpio TaxID=7962 RepID=A0A8C1T683_CYPCA
MIIHSYLKTSGRPIYCHGRYIGRYLAFFKYRHRPISFFLLPWLYLKNMIPNAHKLPRILSALLVTVFTSFLIIFFIKYLFICEKYIVI